MAENDRVSGNKRSFSDGEGGLGGKRTRTLRILGLDDNGDGLDDIVADNFEIVESLRRRGKETACAEDESRAAAVGRRNKMPVRRRPRMRLIPAREMEREREKERGEKKVCFAKKIEPDIGNEEDLIALFANFDWRKIGWEDIDDEDDRRLWRSAAEEIYWKIQNRRMDQRLEPFDRPKEADCC
ncbi:hypothetical protein H6P81_020479 [Aristolochia fimbriata]|uniref:Uncharacterized protein n=1 Tax=Aristolochia fimbriata TaxID=158543 RepID=A0AAV7DUU1_ARIFI|nr:hypothetical protein H6P81_020479 [Aristolochia fimbriata]